MRKIITIFIVAFFMATMIFCYGNQGYNLTSNNYLPGGASIGNINMGGYYVSGINYLKYITNGYLGSIARTTNAVAYYNTVDGGDAYAQAAAGTNSAGGNIFGSPGIGASYTTVTGYATSATDTLDVYVTGADGVTTKTTKTADGASWPLCSATSNAACALALKNSAAIAGVTMSCTDGTCSDAKVFFQPDATTIDLFLVATNVGAGAVYGTVTMGTHGAPKFYAGITPATGLQSCNGTGYCTSLYADGSPAAKPNLKAMSSTSLGGGYAGIQSVAADGSSPTSFYGLNLFAGNAIGGYSYGQIGATGVLSPVAILCSNTGTIGWSLVAGANTACTTTCTNACVFGQDTATMAIVACADATADACICAGAN